MTNPLSQFYRAFVSVPRLLLRTPGVNLKDLQTLFAAIDKYAEAERFAVLRRQSRIRDVYLAEIFGRDIERVVMPFGAVDEETGKPNAAELLYVSTAAKFVQAQNVFEFGTYMGRTTYFLTFASESVAVTTLDLPLEVGETAPYRGIYFRGSDREDKIRQVLCDSKAFDPTPFRKKMDFVFVDGDHTYEGVKNDTEKAFEMLAPGGVIMWHDYGASSDLGLARFFVEFTQKVPLFRIKKSSLLLYRDGIDAMSFALHDLRPSVYADTRSLRGI